jgi:hypothetical protein
VLPFSLSTSLEVTFLCDVIAAVGADFEPDADKTVGLHPGLDPDLGGDDADMTTNPDGVETRTRGVGTLGRGVEVGRRVAEALDIELGGDEGVKTGEANAAAAELDIVRGDGGEDVGRSSCFRRWV